LSKIGSWLQRERKKKIEKESKDTKAGINSRKGRRKERE